MMLLRQQQFLMIVAAIVSSASSVVGREVPKGLENYKPQLHGMFAPRGERHVDDIVIKQDEKGQSFQMTPRQYCDACHATIDTAVILLRRAVEYRGATVARGTLTGSVEVSGSGSLTWNSDKMVHEVCNEGLGRYKPHLPVGCLKLFDQHRTEVMAPWLGPASAKSGQQFDNNVLVKHKLDFCSKVNACQPFYLNAEYQPSQSAVQNTKDSCTNCLLLASDMRVVLNRLLTTMPVVPSMAAQRQLSASNVMSELALDAFVDNYCESLALRHYKSGKVIDVCNEVINQDDISALGALQRNGTFLSQQFRNETEWQQTLCVKFSNVCTKAKFQDIHMTWQRSTEADYAVLEAEDNMYKSDAKYEQLKKNVHTKFMKTAIVELLREYEQEYGEDYEEEHAQSLQHEKEEASVKVQVKPAEKRKKGFRQKNVKTVASETTTHEAIKVTKEIPDKLKAWERVEIDKIEQDKQKDKYRMQFETELQQRKEKALLLKKNRRVWTLPNEYYLSPRIAKLLQTDTEKDITKEQGKIVGELLKKQQDSEESQAKTVEFETNNGNAQNNKDEL